MLQQAQKSLTGFLTQLSGRTLEYCRIPKTVFPEKTDFPGEHFRIRSPTLYPAELRARESIILYHRESIVNEIENYRPVSPAILFLASEVDPIVWTVRELFDAGLKGFRDFGTDVFASGK